MADSTLQLTETHTERVCIVAISGRIDSTNASQLLDRLQQMLAAGGKSVLVDLKDVMYLTSAAFRALLVATDEAERRAARLALCGVLGQVRELFEMGGLLDAFTIFGSREEAVGQLA